MDVVESHTSCVLKVLATHKTNISNRKSTGTISQYEQTEITSIEHGDLNNNDTSPRIRLTAISRLRMYVSDEIS